MEVTWHVMYTMTMTDMSVLCTRAAVSVDLEQRSRSKTNGRGVSVWLSTWRCCEPGLLRLVVNKLPAVCKYSVTFDTITSHKPGQ